MEGKEKRRGGWSRKEHCRAENDRERGREPDTITVIVGTSESLDSDSPTERFCKISLPSKHPPKAVTNAKSRSTYREKMSEK